MEEIGKQDLSKIVVKGSLYNLISLFVLKFGGLVFTILLARLLLPELFGIYSLVLSIATIALTFTDLGLGITATKYISEALGKGKENEARSYSKFFLKKKLILALVVVLVLLGLSKFLSFSFYENPLIYYPLLFSCLFIISEAFREFFSIFFVVRKDFKSIMFLDLFSQTSKIIFSVIALLIFTGAFRVSSLFISFFLAGIVTLSTSLILITQKEKSLLFGNSERIATLPVNNYWKYMVLTSLSLTFFGSIDMLMLGKFVNAEHLGYYRASISLVLTIATLFSLSSIFLPIFTQIHGNRFKRGFHKTMRYILILSIPATIGALFIAKYLIKIVYGNEYLAGTLPFYFLIPLIITTPLIAFYSTIFQSKENPKIVSNAILISLLANIILNLIALSILRENPFHTIAGIGFATSLSRILLLGILISSARKKFGFTLKGLGIKKPLLATIVMSLFLVLFHRIVDMNIFLGIVEVIFGVLIYFGIMVLVRGITKEDFIVFSKVLKR